MRLRIVIAAFLAVIVVAGVGIYVAIRAVADRLPELNITAQDCTVRAAEGPAAPSGSAGTAGDVSLSPSQTSNAATIAAVGLRRGLPLRAIVVALATAQQESKLENLAGGDRDSIGLFQQRPSQEDWGTAEQIRDPRHAAGKFYDALVKVPGWEKMRVTDAAQAVQVSATPEAYERWAERSEVLARALSGEATGAVTCELKLEPEERGATAANALLTGVKLDWGNVGVARSNDVVGITMAVADAKAGWRYAHWLVAHAETRGIKRVVYSNQEWTAKSGNWAKASPDVPATGSNVVAEVYS